MLGAQARPARRSPSLIGLHQARLGRAALGLVGDEVDVLAGLAQHLREALVERRHAGPRVDHEEDDVGVA